MSEKAYPVFICNNTNELISTYLARPNIENLYPDTTLVSKKPDFIFDVEVFECKYYLLPVKYAEIFSYLPSDTLSVYIFDTDVLAKYPWDSIRSKYSILARYDVSLADLENRNFKLEYPYDSTLGKLKVYKP